MNRPFFEPLDPGKKLYRITDLAQIFGLTVQAIHAWLKSGRIRHYSRTSRGGTYLLPREEMIRILKESGREVPGLWKKSPTPTPMSKVLVIDDNPQIRALVEDASQSRDFPFEARTAANAEDGLVLATQFMPAVILLDYFFGTDRLRGDRALAFIRKAKLMSSWSVVGMTGDPRIARKMMRAGANGILLKPFGLEDLRTAILKGLRKDGSWPAFEQAAPSGPRESRTRPISSS